MRGSFMGVGAGRNCWFSGACDELQAFRAQCDFRKQCSAYVRVGVFQFNRARRARGRGRGAAGLLVPGFLKAPASRKFRKARRAARKLALPRKVCARHGVIVIVIFPAVHGIAPCHPVHGSQGSQGSKLPALPCNLALPWRSLAMHHDAIKLDTSTQSVSTCRDAWPLLGAGCWPLRPVRCDE
jgi:hypothetical protein